jgi:photosystem II stability/assembly factor-like uncharacterized protein
MRTAIARAEPNRRPPLRDSSIVGKMHSPHAWRSTMNRMTALAIPTAAALYQSCVAHPRRRSRAFLIAVLVLCCLGSTQSASAGVNAWTSIGPEGGTVKALAIDPASPTTLYAGTARGGVFKSTDGGGHWSATNTGLGNWSDVSTDLSPTAVNAFVVDPLTPTTLYAGTNAGVFKTTDGGGSWSAALVVTHVLTLAIDPRTPTTLYAGTSDYGVFKSTDGGSSWSAANAGLIATSVNALAVDPMTPTTLYAGGTDGGIFKSTNGGGSWSAGGGLAVTGAGYTDVLALAIDPRSPTTLYASARGCTEFIVDDYQYYCFSYFNVFKSADGGGSWTAIGDGLASEAVYALTIDPQSSTTLYAGTAAGVFTSADGGSSWSSVNTGLTVTSAYALAIDPLTPTTLYAGTADRGVFKTTDGGGSWSAANTGLSATYVLALAINLVTPTTLYATLWTGSGAGVIKSADGGNSWSAINTGLTATHVQALAIDPQTPTTLYAGTDRGVFKTTDGGGSWSSVSNGLGGAAVGVLIIDPLTPTTLYAGAYPGVFKTTDGGGSWSAVNTGLTFTNISTLAIDPLTPTTLYAGAYPGLFKTTDGGGSWSALNTPSGGYQDVYRLAINPQTPTILYLATSCCYDGTSGGGVFKTTDGGGTWSAVNTGLTNKDIFALAIDPQTPTTLYAVVFHHQGILSGGVFKSADAGGSWSAFNPGLTVLNIRALAIDPLTPTTLYAGTAGGGVFVATRENVPVNVPPAASFTSACSGVTCNFNGSASSDPDGTITSYAWNFGDGTTGSGPTVSHTYAAVGAFTATLTVTDNGGATGAQSKSVTVTQAVMHVGDLDRSITNQGSTWTAIATTTVHDSNHSPVANATVSGSWSGGGTGSCTTNASGQCVVSKSTIPKSTGSVTFTVVNVTHAMLSYQSADNHDPDGDSNGTSLTLSRP